MPLFAAKTRYVWLRYVTKGMYPLVPNSSKGDMNPYTITVTGPESSLRNRLRQRPEQRSAFS